MKITRVRLRNIRCFDELEMDLGRKSALIIGDNGDGKSTVIRSIAMGLCDESSSAALFRELYGETIRKGRTSGLIEVDLSDGTLDFRTHTTIRPIADWERPEQKVGFLRGGPQSPKFRKVMQEEFPWDRIFAVGYGPGIRVQGVEDYDYYFTSDSVYPLFRYDASLQNPELVVRRLIDSARRGRDGGRGAERAWTRIRKLLKNVLQLKSHHQVELTSRGIAVRGQWGRAELSSLGDGYRSTITWILDLLSWWFLQKPLSRRTINPVTVRGIVLIDEIEQHLHPRWQRNIMRLLTQSLPQVQFIVTTHSPLVASGCEGIPVHRLGPGGHSIEHPFGWLAEDVYRMMGLRTSRAPEIVDRLSKFEALDLKRLRGRATASDMATLRGIRRSLDRLPAEDPVRLMSELKNLRKTLESTTKRRA